MIARTETSELRLRIYDRLALRNRLVAILRVGVPVLGALVLLILAGQLYVASLSRQYGISGITMDRGAIVVGTPRYAGILPDGTIYRVAAESARSTLTNVDVIDLANGTVTLLKANGVEISASAPAARLATEEQTVTSLGLANLSDSSGTRGTLNDATVDLPNQTLRAAGDVHFQFANGSSLKGGSMTYDAKTAVWTFTRAEMTIPETPGADP